MLFVISKVRCFMGFFFQPSSSLNLVAYTDVDWVSCTSGYCVLFCFFVFFMVIWSLSQLLNKRWFHTLIPSPSIGAWPMQWSYSLRFNPFLKNPLFPYFSSCYLAVNLVLHSRAKHVEINYHFV